MAVKEFTGALDQPMAKPFVGELDASIAKGKTPPAWTPGNIFGAAVEPNLALLSGAAAQPIAGLVGLADVVGRGMGLSMPDPSQRIREVQEGLTYRPRTEAGKRATEIIGYPFQKLTEFAERAGENTLGVTRSPKLAASVTTGIEALPAALGLRRTSRLSPSPSQSLHAVRDATLREARQAGYVLPPSQVRPTAITKALESVGGKAALKQEATIRNQQVTNRLAARTLGLPEDQPITEGTLQQFRKTKAAPYEQVAKLNPATLNMPWSRRFHTSGREILDQLNKARMDTRDYWKEYRSTARIASRNKAEKAGQLADSLESELEARAIAAGQPTLVNELRASRQAIAKSYEVEKALNIGSGEVEARQIGRALDKGAPLTGELRTIGKFAEGPGRQFTAAGSSVPTPGVSALGPFASEHLALLGIQDFGLKGTVAGGLPLLRGPARSALLSEWYQNRYAQPRYRLGPTSRLQARALDPAIALALSQALAQQQ